MRTLLALAALTTLGCQSTLTGNEGNFTFSYWADDWVTDFNKPVAVGASLDLEVRGVGSSTAVDLTSAAFDDPTVLDVVSFSAKDITLSGIGEGLALLEVEGTLDGETLTDSVNMQSKVPEVLELNHTCTDLDDAAYLLGREVVVGFEMEMANTQPVIGYGYIPATLDATTAALGDSGKSQVWITVNTGETPESVVLSSTIDDTTLGLQLAAEAELDGVQDPVAFVLEDIDVGDTNAFFVRPMVGGLVVCQGDATVQVSSDTPDTCTVVLSDSGSELERETGWFEVTGVAEGTCQYTVTYPHGAAGAGVSGQFSYPIEP